MWPFHKVRRFTCLKREWLKSKPKNLRYPDFIIHSMGKGPKLLDHSSTCLIMHIDSICLKILLAWYMTCVCVCVCSHFARRTVSSVAWKLYCYLFILCFLPFIWISPVDGNAMLLLLYHVYIFTQFFYVYSVTAFYTLSTHVCVMFLWFLLFM